MTQKEKRKSRKDLLYSVSDTALAGILDGSGVFAQSTTHGKTSLWEVTGGLAGFPLLLALGELSVRELDVENALVGINGDDITIVDETDGTADRCLRDNVADQEAVGTTGETAISDESAGFTETGTHDGTGGLEHFCEVISIVINDHVDLFNIPGMPGPPLGPQ